MRKILFFILSFLFISISTFIIRAIDNTVFAQGTQKQGTLQFPSVDPDSPTQSTELPSGTQQVDWVFDNQGRCWNSWSAPSCGLQQHEGGVTVPSMRDLDQDGIVDISCSTGGTNNGTTITNTSNKTITINCEQYTCLACATGNGIHAQCDGGTDKNAIRVAQTVELTPGCVATCTMSGAFGTCLESTTSVPTQAPTTVAPTTKSNTPTTRPTVIPTNSATQIPTSSNTQTPTNTPVGKHMPVAIDYSSYVEAYNKYPPTYVYAMMNRSYNAQATTRGISGLANVKGNVNKMIMISEYNALEQILTNHGDAIKAAGVTWVGYNAERDGRTPEDELINIFSSNASVNVINKMGKLTDEYGLKLMLGPVTPMWNEYFGGNNGTTPKDGGAAIKAMFGDNCYLDGIAFQEQKQITNSNKAERTKIVGQRTKVFRDNAPSCPQFESMVQLMSSWCTQNASWDECKAYYNLLKGLAGEERINSLAIWASGDERNDLQRFIDYFRN